MGSVPKINGKTLGLVAFGNIARAVARRAKGFNLTILAHDPFVTPEAMAELGVESAIAGARVPGVRLHLGPRAALEGDAPHDRQARSST